MAFGAGERFGNYEIIGPLGAGGMGEVYRARDCNLKRDVAIKVLPQIFSHDAERVARLRREAEVLASLNHSHIAAIYDLVEVGTQPCLVLELVEGDTLADRIGRGPLTCQEALEIARQIAAALEAAHDRGIIHRDLKPANIKITPDGHVKVLDFGLAKVHADAGGNLPLSDVSTMMATTPGLIVGTVAYMSPEQANGGEASRSSDMWAFGCVLYEMLTGRRAFEGTTASEILANVLKTEPDPHRLPPDTPERIRRLLRRSLQKDQKLRVRDMRDARLEFNEGQGQFSPDGQWIAYQSDKTGRPEIYLRPFPGPGDDVRASIDGGAQARWNPNGQELFYIGADDRLMAVPIRFSAGNKTIEPGAPRGLFGTNVGSTVTLAFRQQYLVSPDGQSFVMNSAVVEGTASPITVILNWKPEGQ